MWKQGDEVWTLKKSSQFYNGLFGPGTLDEAAVLEALRPIFGEFRVDSPEEPVFLRVGMQPGIYELTSTLDCPLTLTAKTSPGGRVLSGLDRQSFPEEGGEFTIYEGDWEDYYGVEIELHDAETGASLFRRVYLLDGWMQRSCETSVGQIGRRWLGRMHRCRRGLRRRVSSRLWRRMDVTRSIKRFCGGLWRAEAGGWIGTFCWKRR